MADFHSIFDNDDPTAKIAELREHWYIAVALIASNLPYCFAIQYFYRVGLIREMVSVAVGFIFSVLYHTCQTTGYCDHLGLERWTVLDHISAASIVSMLAIAFVDSHNIEKLLEKLRLLQVKEPPQPYDHVSQVLDLGGVDVEAVRTNYRWTNGIVYCYLFVVILSSFSHPYSMQNNLIVMSVGMVMVLIKLSVIDNGNVDGLLARISVPDLVVGIILYAIGMIYFILDGWIYYWQFHSLWHTFSSMGTYFYAAGISKDLLFAYSPVAIFQEKVGCASRKKRANMRIDPTSPY